MRVFFSGIGGVGIGPLAQIAQKAGYSIAGSDMTRSLTTDRLQNEGINVHVGDQTSDFLREEHTREPFQYFVYTAALPRDHPELQAAHELGIMCLKRDGLLARILKDKRLKMIAAAGTHGKTSTAGLLVWILKQLGIPVSYSIGTTINFGPSGDYDPESEYFVYECDEYDRNFLHFMPELSLITSVDYDHPDTYPTVESYKDAFNAFIDQSSHTLMWRATETLLEPTSSDITVFDETIPLEHLHLAGSHLRHNAFLAERAVLRLFPNTPYHNLIAAINSFPGTDRRMEQLVDNLYSDYGHHPTEIAATLAGAKELSDHVVLVYQPHQNVRQHLIQHEYTNEIFHNADEIYWLPTYLSRENPALDVLTPEQLSAHLHDQHAVHAAEMNDELWDAIQSHLAEGHLVLAMGAGSIDEWLRDRLANTN